MVYHLRNDLDEAIIKYHEVCSFLLLEKIPFSWYQSLSVDPANPHILEVLNMAINTVTAQVPGQTSPDTEFRQAVKELDTKLKVKTKGKERALLGLGLPHSHSQAAVVPNARSSRVLRSTQGKSREEEWDEMIIG